MFSELTNTTLAFFGMPGGWEWIIILVVALLIFGKRLPEVGKSLGKGIVEFKKGLKGVEDEIEGVEREVDDSIERDRRKSLEARKEEPAVEERDDEAEAVGEKTTNKTEA